MSKSRYVTGLRAVEQLLATPDAEVRRDAGKDEVGRIAIEARREKDDIPAIDLDAEEFLYE